LQFARRDAAVATLLASDRSKSTAPMKGEGSERQTHLVQSADTRTPPGVDWAGFRGPSSRVNGKKCLRAPCRKRLAAFRVPYSRRQLLANTPWPPPALQRRRVAHGRMQCAACRGAAALPLAAPIIERAAQASLAVMCPACSRSPNGPLALMESANRMS
jgi:hypothetical protein